MKKAALIIALTIAAYLPALRAGFVFDDYSLITDNPLVKAGDGLYRFWFTTDAPDYYPLTWSLWWLEWRLWGDSPAGYHLVNVLLHAGNAVLVWLVLRRLRVPGAWVAGLLFAVHPVNVATAAWISEQKNTLSMLFYAGAILAYLNFDETRRWSWYAGALGLFLLALLSKSAVAMLPVVLLLCIWWQRGRVERRDLARTAPFFALALALGLVTVWFQQNQIIAKAFTGEPMSVAARVAMAGQVPWFYLVKALWPVGLTVIYPRWEINPAEWSAYGPGVAIVFWLAACWWRRGTWGRPALFATGYFLVTLFPVLGFFDQSFYRASWVTDHWQYYSIAGVIAVAVAAAKKLFRQPVAATVVAAIIVLVLAAASWSRCRVYTNNLSLWTDNLEKNPAAWLAHFGLGVELKRAGLVEDAMAHYQTTLRLAPAFVDAHVNLGVAWQQIGNDRQAIKHYQKALRLKPGLADAHFNLAVALEQAGNVEGAINHYEQAAKWNPEMAEADFSLGLALVRTGRVAEAMRHWERALRINPKIAEAHYNLAVAYEMSGQREQAVAHYRSALQLRPEYPEAKAGLGRAGKLE